MCGGEQEAAVSEIKAELIRKERVRRILRLSGGLEATVEYDGRPTAMELVRVNGQVAAQTPNLSISLTWLVPHFEFHLPSADGDVECRVDIAEKRWWLGDMQGFRLTVADTVVYADGTFGDRGEALPVPAHAPVKAVEGLPVAAEAPSPDGESFPVAAGSTGKAV